MGTARPPCLRGATSGGDVETPHAADREAPVIMGGAGVPAPSPWQNRVVWAFLVVWFDRPDGQELTETHRRAGLEDYLEYPARGGKPPTTAGRWTTLIPNVRGQKVGKSWARIAEKQNGRAESGYYGVVRSPFGLEQVAGHKTGQQYH